MGEKRGGGEKDTQRERERERERELSENRGEAGKMTRETRRRWLWWWQRVTGEAGEVA